MSYAFVIDVSDILAKENVDRITLAKDEVDEFDMYAINGLFKSYEGRLCTLS